MKLLRTEITHCNFPETRTETVIVESIANGSEFGTGSRSEKVEEFAGKDNSSENTANLCSSEEDKLQAPAPPEFAFNVHLEAGDEINVPSQEEAHTIDTAGGAECNDKYQEQPHPWGPKAARGEHVYHVPATFCNTGNAIITVQIFREQDLLEVIRVEPGSPVDRDVSIDFRYIFRLSSCGKERRNWSVVSSYLPQPADKGV